MISYRLFNCIVLDMPIRSRALPLNVKTMASQEASSILKLRQMTVCNKCYPTNSPLAIHIG